VAEPLVLRLTLQRQAEQAVQKARHSRGNVNSGRPEHGVTRGPVGRRRSLLLLGDRLTARPKHSDFRERIFLRGKIKERRSWSKRKNGGSKTRNRFRSKRGSPGFSRSRSDDRGCSKLSKEGSQRASFALVSGQKPGRGARQKRAAERRNMRRPFTWRFRPTLLLRNQK